MPTHQVDPRPGALPGGGCGPQGVPSRRAAPASLCRLCEGRQHRGWVGGWPGRASGPRRCVRRCACMCARGGGGAGRALRSMVRSARTRHMHVCPGGAGRVGGDRGSTAHQALAALREPWGPRVPTRGSTTCLFMQMAHAILRNACKARASWYPLVGRGGVPGTGPGRAGRPPLRGMGYAACSSSSFPFPCNTAACAPLPLPDPRRPPAQETPHTRA